MLRNVTAVNAMLKTLLHLNTYTFCRECARKYRKSPKDDSELTSNSKADLHEQRQRS